MRDRITHADTGCRAPPIDPTDGQRTRAVALENLALRQQLAALTRTVKRLQLRMSDRLFWIVLAKAWRQGRTALIVVRPETVPRWHRQWFRRRWTQRSKRIRPGRPSTDAAIRTLVEKMAAANLLWGAPRIHGELRKLGIEVSERTVSRLLRRRCRPRSQTWRTFLDNHVASLVSMDFFTVPTLTGRVLFVLVLLTHHRRRIVHFAITEHPTAAWRAQRLIEVFPDDTVAAGAARRSAPTPSIPSLRNSPWIRGAPHSRLAAAIFSTSVRMAASVLGRPGRIRFDRCVHRRRNHWRCQRSTVSGRTTIKAVRPAATLWRARSKRVDRSCGAVGV